MEKGREGKEEVMGRAKNREVKYEKGEEGIMTEIEMKDRELAE